MGWVGVGVGWVGAVRARFFGRGRVGIRFWGWTGGTLLGVGCASVGDKRVCVCSYG